METSAWNKRIYERLIKINVNKYNLVPYEKNKWIIIINIIIIIKNTWFLEYATPENVTNAYEKMGVWQYYKRCIILYLYNCQSKKSIYLCIFLLIHSVHYARIPKYFYR